MESSERPSKAAGRVLKVLWVLRGAENVPDSSFEAQQKQLHGKAAKGRRKLLGGF